MGLRPKVRPAPNRLPPLDIIDKLIAKRLRLGLSQADLAERLGYSKVTVRSWELRYRTPDVYTLVLWAQALGYTLTLVCDGPAIPAAA